MRDLSPHIEVTSRLLQGVELRPEAAMLPDIVQFSTEYQVMGLTHPKQLVGYVAASPDEAGNPPDVLVVNKPIYAVRQSDAHPQFIDNPGGQHVFNTQEALTASLGRSSATELTYGLYTWEVNLDNLDAQPYGRFEWLRSVLWRPPEFADGTRIHGPSLTTMLRYQQGRLNYWRQTPLESRQARDNDEASQPIVPPRRMSVFTRVLILLGTVRTPDMPEA